MIVFVPQGEEEGTLHIGSLLQAFVLDYEILQVLNALLVCNMFNNYENYTSFQRLPVNVDYTIRSSMFAKPIQLS